MVISQEGIRYVMETNMLIREANLKDIDEIMKIYDYARDFMRKNGNFTQWINGYPQRELLEEDIRKNQCYVLCSADGGLHAVFVLMLEKEPTYSIIENGQWKNDERYGTIHRIAGDGKIKGLADQCIHFCKGKIKNLRADTHEDNKIMQHILEKNGFERCGIIYVKDGSPRIAYQYVGNE
jgi:ribosomal protein S18 acetylase RimI-like enzyme